MEGKMKASIKLCVCLIVFIFLGGCTYRPNVEPSFLSEDSLPKLNVKHPVAIINSSKSPGEIKLCGSWPHTVVGDMYKYTDTAVAIAKNTLQRNNIQVDNAADSKIELSVQPSCTFGLSKQAIVKLKVKTGSGLEKEYTAVAGNFGHPGFFAKKFEEAMSDCVTQMIIDKDIRNYLEK
jgi:hypothetical protein